ALQVRLNQVNHLNACLKHFERRGLLVKRGSRPVNRPVLLRLHRTQLVHGLAEHVQYPSQCAAAHCIRPSVPRPTGIEIPAPVSTAFIPRTTPSVGFNATARTRPSPKCCCTSVTMSSGSGTSKPSLVMRTAL